MTDNKPDKLHSLYSTREKLYTKVIKGRSHNQRLITACIVYGLFVLLPWINLGDRPAVYFDLGARQFHIFWLTFWPQDFMFLAWALIISAFSLFLFTTVAGRLWCGYVCPQTIWTMLFIWIEEKIEGVPGQRKKLDKAPMSSNKFFKKAAKHTAWLIISVITGFSFVAYFYPAQSFFYDLISFNLPTPASVALFGFTCLTYLDAGWLREQVCVYMCPYAKFQSVMYDEETLIVSYNGIKGEPRGSLKSSDRGQCIDCKECIHVCPTGIDIREGVQIECINCALCLDVCNSVMEATHQPQDLITFTTLKAQESITDKDQPTQHHREIIKHSLKRPKTLGYIAVLSVFIGLFIYNLAARSPLEASVIPQREPIYRQINSTTAANDYNIKIANKSGETINVSMSTSSPSFILNQKQSISIEPNGRYETDLQITSHDTKHGPVPFNIIVTIDGTPIHAELSTRFVYPPAKKASFNRAVK
ncbi:MAG: cytochrome c oxidase accessory protein CcoG [Sinobacterium sp.]|nr:cytochrome c oxidase accessory protein CcoG [Sinobacterium sp.]